MTTRKILIAPLCAMSMGLSLYAAMMPPATASISIAITNFRGDWDATVQYAAGAVVTYNGQSYIAIVRNNNVVPTETDAWAVLDRPGPQGPAGATGAKGATGARGATGATGPAGPAGPIGSLGPVGPVGASGPAGPVGATGATGKPGAQGAQGPQGPAGPQGPQGSAGTNGAGVPTCTSPNSYLVLSQGALACQPQLNVNGDGTLTDNSTGLMWELQTDTCSGEITCYNNSYTWSTGDNNPDGTLYTTFLATLNLVTATFYNSTCFANHCDWRIPTIAELSTIIETSAPGCGSGSPCIDPAFGPTQAFLYWSASSYSSYATAAWSVYFYNGDAYYYGKTDNFYARAVRSGR